MHPPNTPEMVRRGSRWFFRASLMAPAEMFSLPPIMVVVGRLWLSGADHTTTWCWGWSCWTAGGGSCLIWCCWESFRFCKFFSESSFNLRKKICLWKPRIDLHCLLFKWHTHYASLSLWHLLYVKTRVEA